MFEELLEKTALELDSKGIPYMVIGGQAVLLYGEPRLTRDIDITLGVGVEQAEEIIAMARDIGLEPLPSDVIGLIMEAMVLPTIDEPSGIRVDFIFSQSSYERAAIGRVRRVRIGKTEVCFTSLEDLIIHKVVAGRPRDIEDLKAVIAKNPEYDRDYISKWLEEFDSALDTEFRKAFDALDG
ncbi:MAG: nucleotidyl transferase AbiEii/AbiGii toxin family protein [Actinomycetota bacterium]